ncbi:MAG: FkbM family methyltransferase [Candidatus Omnitrophica bacterium]|nr:FkbM family methyltransferase [Candidatus Omnitrophota bacterium]
MKMKNYIKNIMSLINKGYVINDFVLNKLNVHPPHCIIEQSVLVETEKGVLLKFNAPRDMPLSYTIDEIIQNKCYLKHQKDIFNGIIIDIGANIGIFSIYASVNYNSKVYAIEMDKFNYDCLQVNVNMNKDNTDIICCNKAISSKRSDIKYKHSYDMVGSFIIKDNEENNKDINLIKSITLEDFLIEMSIDNVDLLKLDCEGSEYEIILCENENTFDKIKSMSIEYHLKNNKSKTLLSEMINKLKCFYSNVLIEHDEFRGNLGIIYVNH